ncbi:DUF2568 domain-containing protein [Allorhizocola rhizosphaerae]|uniref:DUF2568 domain-containing protein n=1 Tax=Allorhizocola rhizosphaerae TaxID=1872709 RepID=UPI000E3DD7C0|nr:DUF2568 domain-containing protein [Allorhizocola rhizosphaerae]
MMPRWNLVLRFVLEVAALIGLAVGGHRLGGWPVAIALVLVAAAAWVVFAVPGDPSRSGRAPVPVSGIVRLFVEVAVIIGGAVALIASGYELAGYVLGGLFVLHLAFSPDRLNWLAKQGRRDR